MDINEAKTEVKEKVQKVVNWRDWVVNYASDHPKTMIFVVAGLIVLVFVI